MELYVVLISANIVTWNRLFKTNAKAVGETLIHQT